MGRPARSEFVKYSCPSDEKFPQKKAQNYGLQIRKKANFRNLSTNSISFLELSSILTINSAFVILQKLYKDRKIFWKGFLRTKTLQKLKIKHFLLKVLMLWLINWVWPHFSSFSMHCTAWLNKPLLYDFISLKNSIKVCNLMNFYRLLNFNSSLILCV